VADEIPQKKRSPWLYVGIGCAAAVVLLCGGTSLIAFFTVNAAKNKIDELNDTSKREAAARAAANEELGGVPEGYYPLVSFGMPLIFDMIQFTDQPPLADGGFVGVDRTFMFMRMMETEQSSKMRDYFEGKKKDTDALKANNVNIDAKEELARGEIKLGDRRALFVAVKGKMQTQGPVDTGEDGIVTTLLFDCPKDGKLRIGVWSMHDPKTEDLKGTVADPTEMQKLLTPLSPCGK
jgi:hypothetical protein